MRNANKIFKIPPKMKNLVKIIRILINAHIKNDVFEKIVFFNFLKNVHYFLNFQNYSNFQKGKEKVCKTPLVLENEIEKY